MRVHAHVVGRLHEVVVEDRAERADGAVPDCGESGARGRPRCRSPRRRNARRRRSGALRRRVAWRGRSRDGSSGAACTNGDNVSVTACSPTKNSVNDRWSSVAEAFEDTGHVLPVLGVLGEVEVLRRPVLVLPPVDRGRSASVSSRAANPSACRRPRCRTSRSSGQICLFYDALRHLRAVMP